MVNKSFKLLLLYITGVVVSLFLTIPLSPLVGFNPKLFSVITAIVAIRFMYSDVWKIGKYDALKKIASPLTPLKLLIPILIITVMAEIFVAVYTPSGVADISMIVGTVWFFPAMGFISGRNDFALVTIVYTLIITASLYLAYYMGIKGFSLTEKVLNARRDRIEAKAKKHFDEIEKIKEQYRK